MSSSSSSSSTYHSMDNDPTTPQPPRRKPSPSIDLLNAPSPGIAAQKQVRPPSPLRNGFVPNTFTGIDVDVDNDDDDDADDDDHDATWRTPSPTSSVSQFAVNIAQRVGSFVGSISPRSATLPTQAELEAEAERERDKSRKEAERILTREAEERRLVEDRVLAMMQSSRTGSPKSLPPTPARAQSLPNPPSPAVSQKDSTPSWWIAAKNRLIPTKEPLTAAQQIIQEAKAREKDKKNNKGKEKDWPMTSDAKYQDPAYLNLNVPFTPPQRRPAPSSASSSPTPSRPQSTGPPMLTPSPMHSSNASSASPSSEPRPLYAQFSAQGALDIPGTLLAIAKRFEKLEKWTVSHVRALEERMTDVEKWLVEKEKEKQRPPQPQASDSNASQTKVLEEVRGIHDEVAELQERVGQLGRDLTKLATTAPANLSAAPSSQPTTVSEPSPAATSHISRPLPDIAPLAPRLGSTTARESTSPPMASSKGSRTRLPYPTGDYAASSDPSTSPSPNSPPSAHSATRSISGLPQLSLGSSQSTSATTGLPNTTSPISSTALPAPKVSSRPPQHISPTPRKRYTVALGGPITAPLESSGRERRSKSPVPFSRGSKTTTADDDDDDDVFQDETIGKRAAMKLVQEVAKTNDNAGGGRKTSVSSSTPQTSPALRIRAQSVYGMSSLHNQSLSAPAPQARPRSTDRIGLGILEKDAGGLVSPISNKFIDPLVIRRQGREKEVGKIAMPTPARGKVAVGQLVAFFDGEK